MTIAEAVEIYNKTKEEISKLKRMRRRIIEENSGFMRDPMGYYRVTQEDMNIFGELLSEHVKSLELKLEQEFK